MRERLTIFLTIVVVLVVLVALNAASYVRVEEEADAEAAPNRSTANAGATGTRALYDFLTQSGYKAVRWTEPPSALLSRGASKPATFVVIGRLRTRFKEGEARAVRRWVEQGGRLVVIDRQPDSGLLPAAGGWHIASELFEDPGPQVRAEEPEDMTAGVEPVRPAQPTLLTRGVEWAAPSRFAARLHIAPTEAGGQPPAANIRGRGGENPGAGGGKGASETASPTPVIEEGSDDSRAHAEAADDPPPAAAPPGEEPAVVDGNPDESPPTVTVKTEASRAPVEHLRDGREGVGALLVDYAYGQGRIVVLSDPFMVANAGLSRADNLQLAVNLVTGSGRDRIIAFDEYHQGLGATGNRALAYFAGTPVVGIFAQAAFIILAVVWSRGRRFARPLPAPRVDRRSNLEFVASMAELQQRARAYDLAVENIYTRTRRALARYGGAPANASYREIAAHVAARSGKDRETIEVLLRECEDAIAGAPTTARQTLVLAARLRDLECVLGIRMRAREIRQVEKRWGRNDAGAVAREGADGRGRKRVEGER